MNTKRAIAKESEEQRKTNVQRMLKEYVNEEDEKLTLTELVQKYQDELTELCKYDKDTQDTFGFVNTWRVFGEVAKVLNYSIFMAEAEQIGYKRTKRGEKPQLNELYRAGNSGEILVDDGEKSTILDFLREIQWE
jgi:type I restriction enzyme M protein